MKKTIIAVCVLILLLILFFLFKGGIVPSPHGGENEDGKKNSIQDLIDGHQEEISEDVRNYTFGEGEFVLTGEQQIVLEDSQKLLENVIVENTTLDEITKKFGTEYRATTEAPYSNSVEYPLFDDESYIKFVIRNSDNKVVEKWLFIYSSEESNVQLSKEINSNTEDLPTKMEQISDGMTFDKVVDILGDGYFIIGETLYGKMYKWKDTWENGAQLFFNNDGILQDHTSASKFF